MPDIAISGSPRGGFSVYGQNRPHAISLRRTRNKLLSAVLGDALAAGFHMAEVALDDAERMLDPGSHLGDDAVDPLVDRVQRATFQGFAHDAQDLARVLERGL